MAGHEIHPVPQELPLLGHPRTTETLRFGSPEFETGPCWLLGTSKGLPHGSLNGIDFNEKPCPCMDEWVQSANRTLLRPGLLVLMEKLEHGVFLSFAY